MPFKHKSISYGLPQDKYNNDLIREYCEDLNCILDLERKPVAVKLFFDEEEYNQLQLIEPKNKLSYCCLVEKDTLRLD